MTTRDEIQTAARRRSSTWRALPTILLLPVALGPACSAHPASGGPTDGRSIVVTKSGDTTEVSVNDAPLDPQNPACLDYCRRLAACWYAVPNRQEAMPEAEVGRACLSEQNDCRTSTTETLCCGAIADCQEFARCQAQSRDVVSDCWRSPARNKR
jgi:hypothetical protein